MLWIPAWIERAAPRLAGMTVVMRKEMLAQRRQLHVWWIALLRVVFLLVLLVYAISATMARMDLTAEEPNIVAYLAFSVSGFLLNVILIALVLPQTAGAIARERETGSLDLLLMTRLRTDEILAGKLLAPLAPFLLFMIPTFLVVLIVQFSRLSNPLLPVVSVLSTIISLLSIGAIGLYCSTLFSNTGRAVGIAIAAVILLVYSPLQWLVSAAMIPMALAAGLEAGIRWVQQKKGGTSASPGFRLTFFILLSVVFLILEILAVYLLFISDSYQSSFPIMGLLMAVPPISLLFCGVLALLLARRRLDGLRRIA